MITPTQIYWFTVIGNISSVSTVLMAIGIIVCLILASVELLLVAAEDGETSAVSAIGRSLRISLAVTGASAAIAILAPSTKEMAAIYVVPKVANSETVSELGYGVKQLAIEWLEELKPKKEATK